VAGEASTRREPGLGPAVSDGRVSFQRLVERLIYGQSDGAGKPVLALSEDAFNDQEIAQP
jgi:hypothetical protein